MNRTALLGVVTSGLLCIAAPAFAQGSVNPTGIDLGPFHSMLPSPIPTQVTTYYPPPAASHRRHHRLR